MCIHSRLRVTLIALSLTALPFSTMAATSEGVSAEVIDTEVSIWADGAPLKLVVHQLGELSALEVSMDEGLEGQVSGRFSGTLRETLARLSANHGVLFDRQDNTLYAARQSDSSSVSVALTGQALEKALEGSLGDVGEMWPGNAVEFREDALRITGHPDFVKRTARKLTTQIARLASESPDAAPLDDISLELDISLPVVDAGSVEVLQDIQEESKPDSDRASLTQPIRWVTDIPGFNTF